MKSKILDMIKSGRGITFPMFRDAIAGFEGDCVMELQGNIVLWPAISKEAIEALEELLFSKEIHMRPTVALTYFIDGGVPNLPHAEGKLPKRGYKKPHWLPIAFYPGKLPDQYQRGFKQNQLVEGIKNAG